MKSTDKKAEFIELRASGKSYRACAKELHIGKNTCERWEKELREKIAERKDERAEELYTMYSIDRESRIKRLGENIKRMESTLTGKDFDDIPPDVLLKLLLKYNEALKAEHYEPGGALQLPEDLDEIKDLYNNVIKALATLYDKQERGEVTPAQVKAQLSTLQTIVTTHNMKVASESKFW